MSVHIRILCVVSFVMASFALLCSRYFEWAESNWVFSPTLAGGIATALGYFAVSRAQTFNHEGPPVPIPRIYPVMAAIAVVVGFLCFARIGFLLLGLPRIHI